MPAGMRAKTAISIRWQSMHISPLSIKRMRRWPTLKPPFLTFYKAIAPAQTALAAKAECAPMSSRCMLWPRRSTAGESLRQRLAGCEGYVGQRPSGHVEAAQLGSVYRVPQLRPGREAGAGLQQQRIRATCSFIRRFVQKTFIIRRENS